MLAVPPEFIISDALDPLTQEYVYSPEYKLLGDLPEANFCENSSKQTKRSAFFALCKAYFSYSSDSMFHLILNIKYIIHY